MTPEIDARAEPVADGWRVDVTLRDARGSSSHIVTVRRADYERLTASTRVTPEDLVRASFAFLLAREPKESILRSFDLMTIGRYFPEYEREVVRALG
jgi:hypothetical protein